MKIDLRAGEIYLPARRPLRLNEARGVLVRCMEGIIWITIEGEADDVFLTPDQAWRIQRNGLCLIESLAEGRIRLEKSGQTFTARARLAIAAVAGKISRTNPAALAADWSV